MVGQAEGEVVGVDVVGEAVGLVVGDDVEGAVVLGATVEVVGDSVGDVVGAAMMGPKDDTRVQTAAQGQCLGRQAGERAGEGGGAWGCCRLTRTAFPRPAIIPCYHIPVDSAAGACSKSATGGPRYSRARQAC